MGEAFASIPKKAPHQWYHQTADFDRHHSLPASQCPSLQSWHTFVKKLPNELKHLSGFLCLRMELDDHEEKTSLSDPIHFTHTSMF